MINFEIVEKLRDEHNLSDDEFKILLESNIFDKMLRQSADMTRRSLYGDEVYNRGLIEFTNYCLNNCYYCGIRRDNHNITRYRLSKE